LIFEYVRLIMEYIEMNKTKENSIVRRLSRYISNRIKLSLYLSFTFFILCLFIILIFIQRRRQRIIISPFPTIYNKMIRLLNFNDDTNLPKDDYHSHSFARGFDDIVVTWPPSTNTTSINDDK
jgi:hypothetical protein